MNLQDMNQNFAVIYALQKVYTHQAVFNHYPNSAFERIMLLDADTCIGSL